MRLTAIINRCWNNFCLFAVIYTTVRKPQTNRTIFSFFEDDQYFFFIYIYNAIVFTSFLEHLRNYGDVWWQLRIRHLSVT